MRLLIIAILLMVVTACSSQQPTSTAMPVLEPGAEAVPEMVVTPESVVEESSSPLASAPTETTESTPSASTEVSTDIREIAIEAYDFGWDPKEVRVQQGERVKLVLSSRSGTHGFGMRDFDINVGPFSPGMSPESVEFVADKTGTFEYRCNVPCGAGHRDMKGKFIVE